MRSLELFMLSPPSILGSSDRILDRPDIPSASAATLTPTCCDGAGSSRRRTHEVEPLLAQRPAEHLLRLCAGFLSGRRRSLSVARRALGSLRSLLRRRARVARLESGCR